MHAVGKFATYFLNVSKALNGLKHVMIEPDTMVVTLLVVS